jgi:uncharacterized Zn finger protein
MTEKVTKLADVFDIRYYGYCKECGSKNFYIIFDGKGASWSNIIATECENCGILTEAGYVEEDE